MHPLIKLVLFGSKLEWDDVIAALWELYSPAKSLYVHAFGANRGLGKATPVHDCTPFWRDEPSRKQFTAVKYGSNGADTFVLSPTMKAYLAACASGQYQDFPKINDLQSALNFDFIDLPGGFAVVHLNGVFARPPVVRYSYNRIGRVCGSICAGYLGFEINYAAI